MRRRCREKKKMKEEAEMNREKAHTLVLEGDREIKRKEWDWEDMTEDGLTLEALNRGGARGLSVKKMGTGKQGKAAEMKDKREAAQNGKRRR